MNKVTFSVLLGNVVEFYDFILFGYLSTYLSIVFFPNYDPYISMMLTFSVFAGGCIIRPVGALIFGHFGDTLGRKVTLKISIAIASISTTAVGLLPSYESVGLLAPSLLLFCRLLQGFSVCGEETGAATYLIESKPKNEAGYASSLVLSSVYGGLALGAGVVFLATLLFKDNMGTIGWRIPFLLAAPFGYLAYKLRGSAKESPVFVRLKNENKLNQTPIFTLLKTHKKELITGIFNCALLAVSIYMFAVYFPATIQTTLKSPGVASALIFFVTLVTALICPWMGRLTDKFGVLHFYKHSIILFIFLSGPVLFLVAQKSLLSVCIGYLLFGLMCATLTGPMFAMLASSFKDNVRYSGVTVAFNLSMTLFGSSAPMVALWLTQHSSGIPLLPFQLIFTAGVAYIGLKLSTQQRTEP
ncbi:MAG: MFS transporter [Gammaproteobacteria bacterium]